MLALICGLTGALLADWKVAEPEYAGRGLTYWVDEVEGALFDEADWSYDFTSPSPRHVRLEAAEHAIRNMGPPAIPFLSKMLRAKDPCWKPAVGWAQKRYPELPMRRHPASQQRHAAKIALIAAGINPQLLASNLAELRGDPELKQEVERMLHCRAGNAAQNRVSDSPVPHP